MHNPTECLTQTHILQAIIVKIPTENPTENPA